MAAPGGNLVNLAAHFAGEEVPEVKKLIDLVERDKGADVRFGQASAWIDHQLLSLLDYGAVAAANVAVGTAAEAEFPSAFWAW